MSLLESEKIIIEIEKRFDVNSLCYKQLNLWPIVRSLLITRIERPEFRIEKDKQVVENCCLSIHPDKQQLMELENYENIDVLFISRPEEYGLTIQGKRYNIWVDPYIEQIQDDFNCLKAEAPSHIVPVQSDQIIPSLFLKAEQRPFHIPVLENAIENFDRFSELFATLSDIEFTEHEIIYTANVIEQYRFYYLDILSRLKPKAVCLVCWYGSPAMGLIWACRDLGITTVDLQHSYHAGHLYYENWTRITPEGYELLPDLFHVWSESFKEDIERTQSSHCPRHKAVVGNNAWMRKVTTQALEADGLDQDFIADLASKPRVILVTMQGFVPLPRHLIEAVKSLPSDWLWLFRCHPGHLYMADEAHQIMQSNGIENYEIQKASSHPLYVLLQHSHHHLTSFSSSCLEALLFGVPTTFFTEESYQRYHKHIHAGFFNCVPSSSNDLATLLRLDYDKEKIKKLGEFFFDMDERTARRAFEQIIAYSDSVEFEPVTDNPRAQNSNQAGLEFMGQGDFEKALHSFWNAVNADSTSTNYLNNLAVACSCLGRSEDAAKCIEMALQIDPQNERTVKNYRELVKAGVQVRHPIVPATT